jgi:glucose-6-phosphate isomerase
MPGRLQVTSPRSYTEFGITDEPLYQQFIEDPARFQFISKPGLASQKWVNFHP